MMERNVGEGAFANKSFERGCLLQSRREFLSRANAIHRFFMAFEATLMSMNVTGAASVAFVPRASDAPLCGVLGV